MELLKIGDLLLPNGRTIQEAVNFCSSADGDCDNCPYAEYDACYLLEQDAAKVKVGIPQARTTTGDGERCTYKKVYICSPYRDSNADKVTESIRLAKEYCAFAMRTAIDILPVAPHIYFTQFLDDTVPDARSIGTQAGLALLTECEEVWVFGDKVSDGMVQEMATASRLGKTLRFFDVSVLRDAHSDRLSVAIEERG